MPVLAGNRLGPFEILAPLGAGAMGEVWRARDPALDREVAIKALPDAFSADAERLARFEREARLLASLNHPNIAAIYGLQEDGGVRFLAMELVGGEDLAERLARGPVALDDALALARQIAAGLEAAHECGVVHRDLKPANIRVSGDGRVKILDFGLAKAVEPGAGGDRSLSPTLTSHRTMAGVVLGTAAYMSPEQARGKPVDRRADVWAFGSVLFEMLAGQRAFAGETVSDTLASVLAREPDWNALPANTPRGVRELLARCLRKDPRVRLRDMGDVGIALDEVPADAHEPVPASPRPRRLSIGWVAAAGLAALLVALTVWIGSRPSAAPRRTTRLSIVRPIAGATILTGPGTFALAPDGTAVAFLLADSTGVDRLWLRSLEQLQPEPIPGTEGASFPFWAPDSQDLGFFADGKLKRVPRSGGAVQVLGDAPAGRGAAWSPAGVIVFAPNPFSPLMRVPAIGGVPEPATVLDEERGERSHRFPSFLADGRRFVYGTQPDVRRNLMRVALASLDDPRGRVLLEASSAPRFAEPGYLVFTRDQALIVQPVDSRRGEIRGDPWTLAELPEVSAPISGTPVVSVSLDGKMAYDVIDARPTALAWFGRDGREQDTVVVHPRPLELAGLSNDGTRVAGLDYSSYGGVLWVFDLKTGTGARLTPPDRSASGAAWSPDDRDVTSLISEEGLSGLVSIQPSNGAERSVTPGGPSWLVPLSIAADGRTLLMAKLDPQHGHDLFVKTLGDDSDIRPWLATPADEPEAAFSHDGRWVAYASDTSGRAELYLVAFPEPGATQRVTIAGVGALSNGYENLWWREDDRELAFVGPEGNTIYVCDVETHPSLRVGAPRLLFRLPADLRGVLAAPDLGRFLLARPVGERPATLTIVDAWAAAAEPEGP